MCGALVELVGAWFSLQSPDAIWNFQLGEIASGHHIRNLESDSIGNTSGYLSVGVGLGSKKKKRDKENLSLRVLGL